MHTNRIRTVNRVASIIEDERRYARVPHAQNWNTEVGPVSGHEYRSMKDTPLQKATKMAAQVLLCVLVGAMAIVAFGLLQGCSRNSNYDAALAAEADRNMPPAVELHEPPFLDSDAVCRIDDPTKVYEVRQLIWAKSRKFPNGGYSAHSKDGWWFRCAPLAWNEEWSTYKVVWGAELDFIHEDDLRLADWQPEELRQ